MQWLQKGKPLDGIHLLNMKQSRSNFKSALDQCRRNEEKIRNEKMANSFKNKKYKEFWHNVNLNKKGQVTTPTVIDGESNPQIVADKFSKKYKSIFDRNKKGISSAESVDINLTQYERENYHGRISQSNVREAIKQLKMAIGADMIHANHLKFCSDMYIRI